MTSLITSIPLATFLLFGLRSIVIDLQVHRLPNKLTVRLTLLVLVSEIATSSVLRDWSQWQPMLETLFWISVIYLVIYALSRNSLGFGDVKFAIPCAVTIGWYAPEQWTNFLWVSFGCAALVAIMFWLSGKASRSSPIAFGPFMYFGVLIVATNALLSG